MFLKFPIDPPLAPAGLEINTVYVVTPATSGKFSSSEEMEDHFARCDHVTEMYFSFLMRDLEYEINWTGRG